LRPKSNEFFYSGEYETYQTDIVEALEILERTFAKLVFTCTMSIFVSIALKSKFLCYCDYFPYRYMCGRVSYLNMYSSLSGEDDVVLALQTKRVCKCQPPPHTHTTSHPIQCISVTFQHLGHKSAIRSLPATLTRPAATFVSYVYMI
jgi:hypothetical protein